MNNHYRQQILLVSLDTVNGKKNLCSDVAGHTHNMSSKLTIHIKYEAKETIQIMVKVTFTQQSTPTQNQRGQVEKFHNTQSSNLILKSCTSTNRLKCDSKLLSFFHCDNKMIQLLFLSHSELYSFGWSIKSNNSID